MSFFDEVEFFLKQGICPSCQKKGFLLFQEGCVCCKNCGWGKCEG